MAFFATSFGGAQLAVNRRGLDLARQRFDRAAALLGIEGADEAGSGDGAGVGAQRGSDRAGSGAVAVSRQLR
jgi:hypothetical protein